MNIIHRILNSTVSGDFRYGEKKAQLNGPNIINTALNYAFYMTLKQNDLSQLNLMTDEVVKEGLKFFLDERGFHVNAPLRDELISEIVMRLAAGLCKAEMEQNYDKVENLQPLSISDEAARIIRQNFATLTDLRALNYNPLIKTKGHNKRILSGQLHPIYADERIVTPSGKDKAVLFMTDLTCIADKYNPYKEKASFINLVDLPDHIKFNPILSAIAIEATRQSAAIDLPTSAYNKARHNFYQNDLRAMSLEMYSMDFLSRARKLAIRDANNKIPFHETLADVALNPEKIFAYLTDEEKRKIAAISNVHESALTNLLLKIQFEEPEEIAPLSEYNEAYLEDCLRKIAKNTLMCSEVYNALERNMAYQLNNREITDTEIFRIIHCVRLLFKNTGNASFAHACIAQPFTNTAAFFAKHGPDFDHQNTYTLINALNSLPPAFSSTLLRQHDFNPSKVIENIKSIGMELNNRHPTNIMVSDIKTQQLAQLIADVELRAPGFLKQHNIDVDDIFKDRETVSEEGVTIFLSYLNEGKKALFENIESSSANVDFLSQNHAI